MHEPTKHSKQRSSKIRAFHRISQRFILARLGPGIVFSCVSKKRAQRLQDIRLKPESVWKTTMTRAVGAYDKSEDHNNFLQYSYLQAVYYLEILCPRPPKGDWHRIWYNLQTSTCNTSASIDQQDIEKNYEKLSIMRKHSVAMSRLQRMARLRFFARVGRPDTASTPWASVLLALKTSHGRSSSSGSLVVLCSL